MKTFWWNIQFCFGYLENICSQIFFKLLIFCGQVDFQYESQVHDMYNPLLVLKTQVKLCGFISFSL